MGRPSRSTHPVARLRRITGLRQVDFAKLVGITPDHLAQVECGRSVSDWLASQIVNRFGALVPAGVPGDFPDEMPRAVVGDKPRKYSVRLPLYTEEHYRAWAERVDGVRLTIPLSGGWGGVLKGLRAIKKAVGEDLGGDAVVEIPLRGASRQDVRRRLTVAIAKTRGLEVRDPPEGDSNEGPDLAVGCAGAEASLLDIRLEQKKGLTSLVRDAIMAQAMSPPDEKRPGRPPGASSRKKAGGTRRAAS